MKEKRVIKTPLARATIGVSQFNLDLNTSEKFPTASPTPKFRIPMISKWTTEPR
jgi:hypothetical protein